MDMQWLEQDISGAELARIMKEQEGARVVAVYDPENAGDSGG